MPHIHKNQKEVINMDEQKSLWDSVGADANDLPPSIKFEINEEITVEFPIGFEKPEEYTSDIGPYCVFNVIHEGDPARIVTSAWTLLGGLKKIGALAGKKVKICKKLDNSKQKYVVELVE